MVGHASRVVAVRHVISICALLFACSLTVTHAETSTVLLALPGVKAWTGDFDGMLKRRLIRILVVPSKTYFFLNKGDTLGLTAETGQEFEKWINKRHAKGPYYIEVAFIPTRRDRIFQELKDGKGDIAAANLTITQERTAIVDFAKPWAKDVKEVLVIGPSAPPITGISDLGGREVMVRASSSFHTHLLALNNRLKSDNHTPIKLAAADENLEDEDLLQMVSAKLIPWTVVDRHTAKLWTKILKNISIREDLTVNEGGEIAWAVLKNSPLLQRELEEFITSHRKFAEDLISQYLFDGKIVRNALAPDDVAKFRQLVEYFKTYGGRYGVDPYMLAAQGYQESSFNQQLRMPSGAVGVMQMMPSTAREELGINDIVTRAEDNIHSGAKYLRYLMDKYLNDPTVANREKVLMTLAAYNAGPENLKRFRIKAQQAGFDPNVWFGNVEIGAGAIVGQETVQYVGNIYKYYVVYSKLLPNGAQ